jgi:hypothetical protein
MYTVTIVVLAHDPEKCTRFSDKIMRKKQSCKSAHPFRKKRIVL